MITGLNIGFYELYNYAGLLQGEEVPNLEGCIPLTQPVDTDRFPTLAENTHLADLLPRLWAAACETPSHLFKYKDIDKQDGIHMNYFYLKDRGKKYVFHLQEDQQLVDGIMHYILNNPPRVHLP